jgi:TolB-like protein/DNA-binding SARP family transcriptional activator/Tfp pilus assembly protein PilF
MYRLILLGGVSMKGPSGSLSGRIVQGRQLALLALLACRSGTPLAREKAAGLLWGDRPEEKARARLSDTLYVLRNGLGEGAIVSVAGGIHLDEQVVRSDVAAFEEAVEGDRWEEAVELYTGPFLDGFHVGGAAGFERWMDGERRRLAARYREALEKLAEAAEGEGDWPGASAWWKERAREELTNSRVALRLMGALANAGNVPGALEHARNHEVILRDELDLPSSQEVRALAEELSAREGRSGDQGDPSEGIAGERWAVRHEDRTPRKVEAPPNGLRAVSHPPSTIPPSTIPPSGNRRTVLTTLSATAGLAILGAGWLLRVGAGGEEGAMAPLVDDPPPVIVVLPFENLGEPDHAYFADGVTEELTARLASVPELKVIARTTALQYRGAAMDIREIGDDLGVDHVLEGTVRWADGPDEESRVRITAQLVRASDGTHVWTDSYDRELTEIFAVQSEIAEQVVAELNLTLLGPAEDGRAREPTGDLEAYDHFLQGRSYIARQFSEDAARAAISQYERAVELDPGFAEAWRRLIHARLWLTWVFGDEEAGLQARDDLARLLELDRDDPEVRLGRAWFLYYGERRYEKALREFEAVRERRPGDAEVVRTIGFLQARMSRPDEALATMKGALELSPRDAELAFTAGHVLRRMERNDEAERYYERAISLAPDMGFPYTMLEAVHLARGDTVRAREARDRARKLGADLWRGGRAELYGRDFAEAAERIRSHPAARPNARMLRYDALADAHGRMGEEGRRDLYADSLLELASGLAPESRDRPRAQSANVAWLFSGLALIHLGKADRGFEQVRRGLELETPFHDALVGPIVKEMAARAFTRAGRPDEAMETLEELRTMPADLAVSDLRLDPEWDPLRDHPRFEQLLGEPPRDRSEAA